MQDLIAFLQTNSALVLANPTPFATFAVLFGGGGFAVGRYLLTERIANLESRIARRDEEIAELKGKQKAPTQEPSLVPVAGTSVAAPLSRLIRNSLAPPPSTRRRDNQHVG
ncbi:hypothetical protein [Mesorhizobium sp. ESP-6-2]|uniref:hypothetical protein n=1 Tax=Mesorhizobium sp. ESP-6-2 TaxID=2876625 RepID=UPI001CCBBD60|nr:hypothetical protein [Mesorhizobium sp. ESP-6-2]MBZ9806945.1 hypothetical protein [Mesorhizobium sp. ESP-6-2]